MTDQPPTPQPPARPRPGFYLGSVAGTRIYLDYSWFVIAAVITFELAAEFFPAHLPGASPALCYALGVATAILFFLSILLHELGHSLVSKRFGIPVPRITLLFIGGLAEISREPDTPRSELWIAIAGPAVSAFLLLLYAVASFACGRLGFRAGHLMFAWLAYINGALLAFNAIPGYPLDGGRVLRAILWARSGNLRRATHTASRIGIAFSWFLMALGVLALMHGRLDAFVYILIGFFLRNAAEAGYLQTVNQAVLAGIRVRDVMTPNPATIPSTLPLNLAVDDFFLAKHHTAFPVADDTREFRGLLRLEFLDTVPREKWPYTPAGDLSATNEALSLSVQAGENAESAMRRLLTPGESRLAVLDGKQVVGIITRHDVLQFIKIRTALE